MKWQRISIIVFDEKNALWLKFHYPDNILIKAYNTVSFVIYILYAKYGLRVHGWCACIWYPNVNNEKANLVDSKILKVIPKNQWLETVSKLPLNQGQTSKRIEGKKWKDL